MTACSTNSRFQRRTPKTFRSDQKNRFLRDDILPAEWNSDNKGLIIKFSLAGRCLRNTTVSPTTAKPAIIPLADLNRDQVVTAWKQLYPGRAKTMDDLMLSGLGAKAFVWVNRMQTQNESSIRDLIDHAFDATHIDQGKDYRLLRAVLLAAGVFSKPETIDATMKLIRKLFSSRRFVLSPHPTTTSATAIVLPETTEEFEEPAAVEPVNPDAALDKAIATGDAEAADELAAWAEHVADATIKALDEYAYVIKKGSDANVKISVLTEDEGWKKVVKDTVFKYLVG